MMIRILATIGLTLAVPAVAQMAPPVPCTAPAPPPPAFAALAKPEPVSEGGTLTIGRAATLALGTAPRFAVAPGHVPAAGRFGGTLRFTVAIAGTYRVGLGSGVWIDVVQGGTPSVSVAHDRGPACSPVRKIVDFRLTPGTYVLQISDSAAAAVGVMVVRAG